MTEESIQQFISQLFFEIHDEKQHRIQQGLDFNVFTCLSVEDKEVIMCRMLQQILDPYGRHGQGEQFLDIFCKEVLKDIGPFNRSELLTARVYPEYRIPESDRRIDLVIQTDFRFIPIEAKIYAEEQKNQVTDYCRYVSDRMSMFRPQAAKDWKLYYLTLDGHAPSEYSMSEEWKDSGKIKCISWKYDIAGFLHKLTDLSVPERVKNVISQYREAVDMIAGNEESKGQLLENAIKTSRDIETAEYISRNLNYVKTDFLRKLFKDIQKEMKNRLPQGKPEASHFFDFDKQINRFYQIQYSEHPGVSWILEDITGHRKHNDGYQYFLCLRFEIEWRPYTGICIARYKDGKYSACHIKEDIPELVDYCKHRIKNLPKDSMSDWWWLCWEYAPEGGNDEKHTSAPIFRWPDDNYFKLYDSENYNSFIGKTVETLMGNYRDVYGNNPEK